MNFLEELQKYADELVINEESVFKPVYIEDEEYETPASFVLEDDETGDTLATISLYDVDGNTIDGINDEYSPSKVNVECETDGTPETLSIVLSRLKGMGFENIKCDGEDADMEDVMDASLSFEDDEDDEYQDAKSIVNDIDDGDISITDLEVDED